MSDINYKDEKEKLDFYLSIYKTYRDYVMQESNLINSRLMWIITINGFLYTTYGFSLQKELEVFKVEKIEVNTFPILIQMEWFLLIVSIVGIIISWFGFLSIRAAHRASHSATHMFENDLLSTHRVIEEPGFLSKKTTKYRFAEKYIFPSIRGGGQIENVNKGHFTSSMIPLSLALSWFFSLSLLLITWYNHRDIFGWFWTCR